MLQIVVVFFPTLVFLQWVWPRILGWSIQRHSKGEAGGFMEENVGLVLLVLGAILAAGLGSWFVLADEERSWTDPEPAVAALGVAVGAVFAYSRLFSPPFWPNFHEVIDFGTGAWSPLKQTDLKVGRGHLWPIFLEVHNAGIAPWNNYRITVELPEGFEVYDKHEELPCSYTWDWKTEKPRIGREPPLMQLQATNILAVAEPQTMRFVLKAKTTGRFKVTVKLVADGRLGESQGTLWIKVLDGLEPPVVSH